MLARFLAVTATALAFAAPALAQKSADTLRVAINNPFASLSTYDLPVDEAGIFSREVYDYLLYYDEHNKKFVGALAKSWKRIDDKTLEFELKDDIKFHNGNAVDANDVKTTIDYVIDPKSKITFIANYNWIKQVEDELARREEREPPRGFYLAKGDLAARRGDDAEAVAHLEREIAAHPIDPRAYARLSVVHTLSGRPREAVAALRRLVEDNQTPVAYAAAVEALRVLGDRTAAARLLRVARGKFPAHPRLIQLESEG